MTNTTNEPKNPGDLRRATLPITLALVLGAGTAQAGPTITYGDEGMLTLDYDLQIWSQYQDYRSDTVDKDSIDTFLRRNRITLSGQFNDYVGFYAQLESGNDGKYDNYDRPVYYRDAYVTFDWTDSVRFIAGRFKNTFSRENLEACLEPLTLDRSLMSYTPFAGSRDTGVAMWGNLANAKLQYRIMVADGREGDDVPEDSARITGRVHYTAFDPEYSYGYLGTYLGTQQVLTIGASYDYQANAVYENLPGRQDPKNYSAWTVDVFYEQPTRSGTFTVSGAYFDYSVDGALNGDPLLIDHTVSPAAEMESYYVKAGYLLPGKVGIGRLQFFARYDESDYDRNDPYYDNTYTAAGFNYYLSGQQLKFTFEYGNVDFDEPFPGIYSLQDYTQATLGFQMLF